MSQESSPQVGQGEAATSMQGSSMQESSPQVPQEKSVDAKSTTGANSATVTEQPDRMALSSESASPTSHPTQKARLKWDKSYFHTDDAFATCLETISELLGRPMSAAAFKAGLPLKDNRMGPEHFVRAAKRAGLSARIVRKNLKNISSVVLPCVLLLEGDKACILVKVADDGQFDIILPEVGKGFVRLPREDIELLYSGYAIFIRPLYQYDQRSTEIAVDKPRAWFWGVITRFWPIYSKVAIAAFFVNLFAIATPLFTMNVYDRVVPNNATDTLMVLVSGIILIYIFDFILKMLRVYFVDEAGKNADVLLASRLFEHVMNLNLSSRPASAGGFANHLREFETLREFFSSASLVAIIDLPFIFLFIGIIIIIGGKLAWIPGVAIPFIVIGSFVFHRPLQAWVNRSFREAAQKHALLVESINGIETVKSFTAEGQMQRNWERFVAQTADSNKYLRMFATLAMHWSSFIQQVTYIGVIVYGVYLINEADLTLGGLIACSILTSRALAPLSQVVGLMTRLNQSRAALETLNNIMGLPVERPQGTHFLHRPSLKGEIEFKDVTFYYPNQKVPALKDFSLHINPGEKVGILGRIGSGKSTIEKLILNLYPVTEGTLSLDGTDIRQIDPADIRHNIGYVPQDVFLFFGTVRDNILFGARDADEGAVLRAAEIAGVLDFVRSHPQGFDLVVGEGGATLSGGQRQAIALARALVRNPSIYLFDEPTAMMDHASEAQFISRFAGVISDKTLILITHRIPLLRMVSRLIVVDNGRVVADGPREEVIRALTNSQIRSF
jgi:ATP-binding cassette subfamily C protein LapB